jgi:tubulin-folding cofactor B
MSILQTSADINVLINSDTSSSERRVNPSWTISQLKSKLLPITGIPPSSQQLTLRLPHAPQPIAIASADEDATQLSNFPLQPYAEIHVCPSHPISFLKGFFFFFCFFSPTVSLNSTSHLGASFCG